MATGTMWVSVNVKNIPLGICLVKAQDAAVPALAQGSPWHWTPHDWGTKHHAAISSLRCSCLQALLYFLQKKHMTQLQGINYSRFFDRRSLLYCIPGDQRKVLNLFILQTFALPEGRICLHREEQSSRAWGTAHPALVYEQQQNQLAQTQLQGTATEALPFILATGLLVWLFLFTEPSPTQLSSSWGLKTFWRWSTCEFYHKTLVSAREPPWWETASWTHCAEPPVLPKATAVLKIPVPLLRAVTAPALPKAHPLLPLWGHLNISTTPGSKKDHSMTWRLTF